MNNIKIAIGIYLSSDSSIQLFIDTLYYLSTNIPIYSPPKIEIILLCDNLEMQLYSFLAQFNYRVIKLPYPETGRAFYFNQLIETDADYYLFLDCGVYLAPKCLRLMLSKWLNNKSQEATSKTGIVGPSINNGWNQQSLYNDITPESVNILQRAEEILLQYKNQVIPVKALQESCFMLSRQVIKTVGYTDEKFANGYCWELDYHKRVHLAGFSCWWIKSAYAHKSYFSNNLYRDITFSANMQRFHKKYASTTSLSHLSKGHIQMNKPEKFPLISCIMPTRGRSHFVKQSIKYFQRQSYPNKELIVTYEQLSDLPKNFSQIEQAHFQQTPRNSSIGYKRNKALRLAKGEIICHWDDDDWHGPDRLISQASAILNGKAEVTALNNTCFFDPFKWEAWHAAKDLYNKLFVEGIPGGTLMYKSDWVRDIKFWDISLREDTIFLEALIYKGARLVKLDGRKLFVYIRHNDNIRLFEKGTFDDPIESKKIAINHLLYEELPFYSDLFNYHLITPNNQDQMADLANRGYHHQPHVSCIMPTKNRSHFIGLAIKYFLRQTYANKELIIIDDGQENIKRLIPPNVTNIKYIHLESPKSVGYKRNMANNIARGEIIIHWEDCDWIANDWIYVQVDSLLHSQADVTGITEAMYFKPDTQQAWKYSFPEHAQKSLLSSSLCYFRKFWQKNQFLDQDTEVNTESLWSAPPQKITSHSYTDGYVGIIQTNHLSPKQLRRDYWRQIDLTEIEYVMEKDIVMY